MVCVCVGGCVMYAVQDCGVLIERMGDEEKQGTLQSKAERFVARWQGWLSDRYHTP